MKVKPILFSTDMALALLEGRKTQTRRVVRPQYKIDDGSIPPCPYGVAGDLLWVRESWRKDFCAPYDIARTIYRAEPYHDDDAASCVPWKPSIHMPRERSRMTLRITEMRIERIQDIKESDAIAEGASPQPKGIPARLEFRDLWDRLNKHRGFGWVENPWVWVVCFEVLKQNVDGVLANA